MIYKTIWLSNISAFGVRDEDYSRNASCALNFISRLCYLFCTDRSFGYIAHVLVNPQNFKHLQVDIKFR